MIMSIAVLRSTRFGLPVDFAAIVIHPLRKTTKRLRDVLDQLFGYLDQSDKSKNNEVNDTDGSAFILHVLYSFVCSLGHRHSGHLLFLTGILSIRLF